MENDWKKIKTYTNAIQAEIVKQMLEENGIPTVAMNKQDSSYLFGKIELYVSEGSIDLAKTLIEEAERGL
ncbi:putative signal transducing protein [Sphingobacterium multivorum]|uniref:putative signal transducing protein n=1 Tax=Sphingobacterium multivorum TaxID=28454 RepID=UPI00369E51FD